MRTNAPTPELYRTAELRRNEELSRLAESRRYKALAPSRRGRLEMIRNLVGRGLILAGRRISPAAERPADIQRPAAA